MSFLENMDDKIYAYLNNEMNRNQRLEFEKEIETNEDLTTYIKLVIDSESVLSEEKWHFHKIPKEKLREIQALFNNDEVHNFTEKLGRLKLSKEKPKNKIYWFRYAAAVTIAFGIGWSIFFWINKEASTKQLFTTHYSTNDLPSFTTQNNQAIGLIKAESLYYDKKYKKAFAKFSEILSSNDLPLDPNILQYMAMCQMQLGNFQESLKILNLLEQSNTLDSHKAYWFKTLVYLKKGDKTAAIQQLKIITQNVNYFKYKEATILLKKLE